MPPLTSTGAQGSVAAILKDYATVLHLVDQIIPFGAEDSSILETCSATVEPSLLPKSRSMPISRLQPVTDSISFPATIYSVFVNNILHNVSVLPLRQRLNQAPAPLPSRVPRHVCHSKTQSTTHCPNGETSSKFSIGRSKNQTGPLRVHQLIWNIRN